MKKILGLIVLAMMVILPIGVNAAVIAGDPECGEDVKLMQPEGNYTHSKLCKVKFTLTEGTSLSKFGGKFTFDTSIIKVKDGLTMPAVGWTINSEKESNDGWSFIYDHNTNVTDGEYVVGTFVFYIDKSDENKDCTIKFSACFDNNGEFICKDTTDPTCYINKETGKYYGKNGTEVTEEEYNKQCVTNPKTGNVLPYAVIAAGAFLAISVYVVSRKNNKLYKI